MKKHTTKKPSTPAKVVLVPQTKVLTPMDFLEAGALAQKNGIPMALMKPAKNDSDIQKYVKSTGKW